jgi:hypothetical protein
VKCKQSKFKLGDLVIEILGKDDAGRLFMVMGCWKYEVPVQFDDYGHNLKIDMLNVDPRNVSNADGHILIPVGKNRDGHYEFFFVRSMFFDPTLNLLKK